MVNTSRTPNQSFSNDPIGPRMPKMISSSQPVTTGGSTSGRCTNAFSTGRPGKRYRASTQAMTTASGSPKPTARAATPSVSQTACHSSGDSSSLFDLEAALDEDLSRLRTGQECHQCTRLGRVAGFASPRTDTKLDHGCSPGNVPAIITAFDTAASVA